MQIECQLGFIMVQIKNGICQYEGSYATLNKIICHFLGPSPSVISGKKSTAQKHIQIDAMLRSGFFLESTLGYAPKNCIYFCSARHISFHIGICHLKLASSDSSTDTLSARIIFISLAPNVTSPVMILDFFFQK